MVHATLVRGGAFGFGFLPFFSLGNRGYVMVRRLLVAFGHEEGSVDLDFLG